MRNVRAATAVLLFPLAVGCGDTASGGTPHGTVDGDFIASGGSIHAQRSPRQGMVTLTNSATKATFETASGADGKFTISVPSGTYGAIGVTPTQVWNDRTRRWVNGFEKCDGLGPVVVSGGQTTNAEVVCERN